MLRKTLLSAVVLAALTSLNLSAQETTVTEKHLNHIAISIELAYTPNPE